MTIDEKLDKILESLERIETRQQIGLQEIKETAPPVMGSFASTSENP